MIKLLKTFFYPQSVSYLYNVPKEAAITKIEAILKKKVAFFSSNDMAGSFLNTDTFTINIISPVYLRGVKCGSVLIGQISELQKGTTQIRTITKPNSTLYFLFFFTIFLGLVFSYRFIQTDSIEFLFWSLAMLVIGPALSIGISNVAITVIRERYKMYIDDEFSRL